MAAHVVEAIIKTPSIKAMLITLNCKVLKETFTWALVLFLKNLQFKYRRIYGSEIKPKLFQNAEAYV